MKNKILVGVLTFLSLLGLLYIHLFIYPFTTSHPNFSDVEKAFDALPIPKDWKIISTSENRGIAGRACPIESDGCYSKSMLVKLPDGIDSLKYTDFLRSIGCGAVSVSDTSSKSKRVFTYYCNLSDGIKIGSDFRVESHEASLRVFNN